MKISNIKTVFYVLYLKCIVRHETRWGEVSPALFQKESALILGKMSCFMVIYGLNFLFKVQFVRVSRRKKEIFPSGVFLFSVVDDCLSKYPYSKKTSFLENS